MTDPVPIRSVADVDLDRHAVIEASAGTGKTYTIERLVVELVRQKGLRLEQILVVTYTEKATGELRQRVRDQLTQALLADPGQPHLRVAVDTFDTAAIHTIHGFCQRMLRQYAFENGEPFDHELVDDPEVYREVMLDLLRRIWPKRFGNALPELLELSGFGGDEEKWIRDIVDLARLYRPQCGDRLLPDGDDADFGKLNQRFRETVAAARALAGPELAEWYGGLKLHASSRRARLEKVIEPLLALLGRSDPIEPRDWLETIERCDTYKAFKENGFMVLTVGLEDLEYQAEFRRLHELVVLLDGLRERMNPQALKGAFQSLAVHDLQAGVRRFKANQGLISYEDMLSLVDEALDGDRNPRAEVFRRALRSRYRYAIVDEFQDTDPLQWRIFREIFTGSEDHRLMLIGDPKQAIYSFRGADLATYQRATTYLCTREGAMRYALPVNYRSLPALLDEFNGLFGSAAWFPPDDGIVHRPVEAPPPERLRARLLSDTTERQRINLIPVDGEITRPRQLRDLYEQIADEIEWLLGQRLELVSGGRAPRWLLPSDICLLVRKGAEAQRLQAVLAGRGIPVSYYKQGGLYQTDQAIQLIYLLQAVADPGDTAAFRKALLTRFFGASPEELAGEPPEGELDPRRHLLQGWHLLAAGRQWARLFQAILEDSGLLLREQREPDGERRLANYRHLTQELYLLAVRDKLDPIDLVHALRHRRHGSIAVDQGEDLQRLETERPKVRVMTIHASKGLEFPVVFLAGGLGSVPPGGYYRYHEREAMVYDLACQPSHRAAHEAESLAEDRRLLYVALTRASHLVYVPWFNPPGKDGPLNGFVADALRAVGFDVSRVIVAPDSAPAAPDGDDRPPEPPSSTVVLPQPLLPAIDLSIRERRTRIASFTSLHRYESPEHERPLDAFSVLADQPWKDDDELLPGSRAATVDDPLPAGTAIGSMLHELFERLDWTEARAGDPGGLLKPDTPAAATIDRSLAAWGMIEGVTEAVATARRQRVAELVHRALTTPLPPLGVRLAEVTPVDRLHELEFHFSLPPARGERIAEIESLPDGYVHGYIDLLFRWQGAYYLLDWKSNLLAGGYGPSEVEGCMRDANYHLQYRLYALAVRRWLRQYPGRSLGGVFYLFLRGIDPAMPGHGVFYRGAGDLT